MDEGNGDYINPLNIVRAYHRQLENSCSVILNNELNDGSDPGRIIPFLKDYCTLRVQNAVIKLLYDVIKKGNLPFDSIDLVTIDYFVRHFGFDDFKNIKNFGHKSFEQMKEVLTAHNHFFP